MSSLLREANPWLIELMGNAEGQLASRAVLWLLAGAILGALLGLLIARISKPWYSASKLDKPGWPFYLVIALVLLEVLRTTYALSAQLPLLREELWTALAQAPYAFWPRNLLHGLVLGYGLRLALGVWLLIGMVGRNRWVRLTGVVFLGVACLQFCWQDLALNQFLDHYNRAITWNFELMSHIINASLLAAFWLVVAPVASRYYQR